MEDYTIAFKQDSPARKLYQKLKADGVKDADLDTGYPETNYVKKTRKTVHQGDHKIEETEVLNYALENYERYQLAIKETTGYVVPWSLDDLNPATEFDAALRIYVGKAISAFKQILAGKGLKPGTGRYNELLALSLYAFTVAGVAKPLGGKTTIFMPNYLEPELKLEGLSGVTDYLMSNGGGLGLAETNRACKMEATALEALRQACGQCTEQSTLLYAVLKQAGLKVNFIFAIPGLSFAKRFQLPPGLLHTSVSVVLDKNRQIFDPSFRHPNAGPFYKQSDFLWWFEQTDREYLSNYYSNLGESFSRQGKFDLAKVEYLKALKIDPRAIEPHHNLGCDYMEQGELDQAIPELKIAVKFNPDYPETHKYLGRAYAAKGKLLLDADKVTKASTAFDQAELEYKRAEELGAQIPKNIHDLIHSKRQRSK